MSTEVEAQNARSQLVGDPQDSRVNLALKSVTPRSYSIYSIPHIAQYLDPYTLPLYIGGVSQFFKLHTYRHVIAH